MCAENFCVNFGSPSEELKRLLASLKLSLRLKDTYDRRLKMRPNSWRFSLKPYRDEKATLFIRFSLDISQHQSVSRTTA